CRRLPAPPVSNSPSSSSGSAALRWLRDAEVTVQDAAMHEAAAKGFAREAQAYARGRPEYPLAIDEWLRDELQLDPPRTRGRLGAGTGKFTLRLLTTGANIIAVEPVQEMLTQLTHAVPSVAARSGTAENLPLNNGVADAVVCAQSFHWFATR